MVQEILREEKTIAQIAAEHGVHPNQLSKWKTTALKSLPRVFDDERKALDELKEAHEQQVKELYAEIGRLTTQLNWLKKKSGIEPM